MSLKSLIKDNNVKVMESMEGFVEDYIKLEEEFDYSGGGKYIEKLGLTPITTTSQIDGVNIPSNLIILGYISDGKLIGYCNLSMKTLERYGLMRISGIVVDKQHRSKGIAIALLEAAKSVAKEHNAKYLTLFYMNQNHYATNLYNKVGFKHHSYRIYTPLYKTYNDINLTGFDHELVKSEDYGKDVRVMVERYLAITNDNLRLSGLTIPVGNNYIQGNELFRFTIANKLVGFAFMSTSTSNDRGYEVIIHMEDKSKILDVYKFIHNYYAINKVAIFFTVYSNQGRMLADLVSGKAKIFGVSANLKL